MLQSLRSTDSLRGIDFQHLYQQVQRLFSDTMILLVTKVKIASPVLSHHFSVLCPGKDALSEEQVMKDDSSTKNITNGLAFSRHILNVDDLWGYKSRSSTPNENVLFLLGQGWKTKIQNDSLGASFFSEHDVFSFQIPMNDTPAC